MSKPMAPRNTENSSKWALSNFKEWFNSYNRRNESDPCPPEVFSPECSKEVLKWLSIFVNEMWSKDGDLYPPKVIQSLLAGIVGSMKLENPRYPTFLSKEDPAFSRFQVTVDNLFRNLCSYGVGVKSCHT